MEFGSYHETEHDEANVQTMSQLLSESALGVISEVKRASHLWQRRASLGGVKPPDTFPSGNSAAPPGGGGGEEATDLDAAMNALMDEVENDEDRPLSVGKPKKKESEASTMFMQMHTGRKSSTGEDVTWGQELGPADAIRDATPSAHSGVTRPKAMPSSISGFEVDADAPLLLGRSSPPAPPAAAPPAAAPTAAEAAAAADNSRLQVQSDASGEGVASEVLKFNISSV